MHTYPNTSIANPSMDGRVTPEERKEDYDSFRIRDFTGEQLLIRPISATVMRAKMGDHPAVFADVLVLTGTRSGHVFHNVIIVNTLMVEILTAVLDNPFVNVTAGKVDTVSSGSRSLHTLTELTSKADIDYAVEQASALRWSTSAPATEKELLAWNLVHARKNARLSQSDAAQMMGWAQPTLSAVESGSRGVSALELRELSRMYRTTMARLLP